MGTARNARIRVAGVPVIYSPYLRFPIDDRRRTGLLIPSIGTSERNGFELMVPFYWNIAPNMDATFYPRFMSNRGLMLGAEVRHLSRFQRIEVDGDVLPNDSEAEDASTRWAYRIDQTGSFGYGLTSLIDFSRVSDDAFLTDFGNRLDVTSTRNLRQLAQLSLWQPGMTLQAWVQDFQTVDPDLPERNRPYAQLPHLGVQLTPWAGRLPVDFLVEGYFDAFDHPVKVEGNRFVLVPSVRWPLRRSFGHLIPRARLFYTHYDLSNADADTPERQSHQIPSLDVDGKLIFERDIDWFGNPALQTLEPRLYYVLTGFEDQSATPLFDTTALDFSFASLFRPNRFTGYDRLGDENRLTLALTSRTLGAADGSELLRASVGQIFYFRDRRVQLRGDTFDEESTSSVAGELAAAITPRLGARASVQWNPHLEENPWEKRVLSLRYLHEDGRLLNFAYRYNQGASEATNYEDTDLAFRLPVTRRIQLVGRWLYSMLNSETVEAFAGIEFGRCCWRMRVLGRHLKTSDSDNGTTSVMLQLELAGLGAFGNSIDKLLEEDIYGYRSF